MYTIAILALLTIPSNAQEAKDIAACEHTKQIQVTVSVGQGGQNDLKKVIANDITSRLANYHAELNPLCQETTGNVMHFIAKPWTTAGNIATDLNWRLLDEKDTKPVVRANKIVEVAFTGLQNVHLARADITYRCQD